MAVYKKGVSAGFDKRTNDNNKPGKVRKVVGAKKPEVGRKGAGNAHKQVKKHKSEGKGQ